jgi:hypothetical protein
MSIRGTYFWHLPDRGMSWTIWPFDTEGLSGTLCYQDYNIKGKENGSRQQRSLIVHAPIVCDVIVGC